MGEKLKIMIIDDEDVVRELVSDMIESLGYEVTGFSDPKKGIDHYKKNWENIDLVLLDMIMPGLNGRETFFLLKKINRNIKSVVLSGFSVNEDIEKILDEGCYAYLKKPVKVDELDRTIQKVLNSESMDENIIDNDNDPEIISFSEYNLEEGLENTGMDSEIFIKMLKRFVENYSDAGDRVSAMFREKKYNELYVYSHSVKSIAAGIGLLRLKAFSEIIESSCLEKNYSDIKDKLDFFHKEMENAMDRIRAYLDKEDKKDEVFKRDEKEESVEVIISYIDKLIRYSEKGRPVKVKNLFEKTIVPVIIPYLDVDFKYKVAKMIRDYNFNDLAVYLKEIKNSINKGEK